MPVTNFFRTSDALSQIQNIYLYRGGFNLTSYLSPNYRNIHRIFESVSAHDFLCASKCEHLFEFSVRLATFTSVFRETGASWHNGYPISTPTPTLNSQNHSAMMFKGGHKFGSP